MAFVSQEKKALGLIASLYLVRMLGLFMVLPVLSLFGESLGGASLFLLGMALGIYGLAQAVFQIPFGRASDRFGRKPMLIIGFLLFILGSIVCALAGSIEMLLVGRAIQGAGAVSSVLLALLADQISTENRTTSMAIVGATIGVSFGLSVVVGPILASAYGLSGIFIFSAILGLIAVAFVMFGVPNTTFESSAVKTSVISVLSNTQLLRLNMSIFSLHFVQMCIWIAVPGVLLRELDISLDTHWLVYLITVGGGFFLMAPFMRYWDRRGQAQKAMTVAIVVLAISLLLLTRIEHALLFMGGLLVFFWGFNLLEATLPSTLTKTVSPDAKGTATGVYSTCQFLGAFLGGSSGGWILSTFSVTAVFYFAIGLTLVWLILMQISAARLAEHST